MDVKEQRKKGIQYSVGEIVTLVSELIAAYGLFYMTTVKLVEAETASIVMSVSTVFASLAGLYIGYAADRSKKGKRVLAFTFLIPALLAFALFFAPFDFGKINIAYLTVTILVFYVCIYCFMTPFDALGGEIVTDYNVRTFMRTLCVAGIYIGVIFADTLSTYIRSGLTSHGVSESMSWFIMALIMVAVSGLAGFFAFNATKGSGGPLPEAQKEASKANIFKAYFNILKVKPIRVLTIWSILFYTVCMIMSPMLLYYSVYVLGLTQTAASSLYLVSVAATLIFTPIAPFIAKKAGKKGSLCIGTAVYIAFALYVLLLHPSGIVPGVIFAATYSVVNTISQACSYSMLYDAADVAEYKTGQPEQSTSMGLMKAATAIGTAIGTFAMGHLLGIGGFDGAAMQQSARTIRWITYGATLFPAVMLVISSLLIVFFYKINQKNHEALVRALAAKREHREYSTEEFGNLL